MHEARSLGAEVSRIRKIHLAYRNQRVTDAMATIDERGADLRPARWAGPLETFLADSGLDEPSPACRKLSINVRDALARVKDGDTVMIGGFGGAGLPKLLRDGLADVDVKGLTLICNNADFGALAHGHQISKLICSYPSGPTSAPVLEQIESGEIELVVAPQGTLVEQIRAGAAGLGGILTPTGVGTEFSAHLRQIEVNGRPFLLAPALRANVALVKAAVADTMGNLACRRTARNFNPAMAMAADFTVAQVTRLVAAGRLDPDLVHVPGHFVDAVMIEPESGGQEC